MAAYKYVMKSTSPITVYIGSQAIGIYRQPVEVFLTDEEVAFIQSNYRSVTVSRSSMLDEGIDKVSSITTIDNTSPLTHIDSPLDIVDPNVKQEIKMQQGPPPAPPTSYDPAAKSISGPANEAINMINAQNDAEWIKHFVEGETRARVLKAAQARYSTLTGKEMLPEVKDEQ
jgi:hypothetical protein